MSLTAVRSLADGERRGRRHRPLPWGPRPTALGIYVVVGRGLLAAGRRDDARVNAAGSWPNCAVIDRLLLARDPRVLVRRLAVVAVVADPRTSPSSRPDPRLPARAPGQVDDAAPPRPRPARARPRRRLRRCDASWPGPRRRSGPSCPCRGPDGCKKERRLAAARLTA